MSSVCDPFLLRADHCTKTRIGLFAGFEAVAVYTIKHLPRKILHIETVGVREIMGIQCLLVRRVALSLVGVWYVELLLRASSSVEKSNESLLAGVITSLYSYICSHLIRWHRLMPGDDIDLLLALDVLTILLWICIELSISLSVIQPCI